MTKPRRKYTFPGAETRVDSLDRYQAIVMKTKDGQAGLLQLMRGVQLDLDRDQDRWDRAVNDEQYSYGDTLRLRDAIWSALYPDCPYYNVDTMEIASMRVRCFEVLDNVRRVVDDLLYDARQEAYNNGAMDEHGVEHA